MMDFTVQKQIIETAIDLRLNQPERFTVQAIAEAAGITEAVFYEHFNSKFDVLPAFYDLCLAQYELVRSSIDGYEGFTLEERIATFIFVTFDALEEQKEFVDETFVHYILHDRCASSFRKSVAGLFRDFLLSDDVPVANRFFTDRAFVHDRLAQWYLDLVGFWIEDPSSQREQTTALTDKLVGFFAELATFRGIDRGLDLLKYMNSIGIVHLESIPFIGSYFKGD